MESWKNHDNNNNNSAIGSLIKLKYCWIKSYSTIRSWRYYVKIH